MKLFQYFSVIFITILLSGCADNYWVKHFKYKDLSTVEATELNLQKNNYKNKSFISGLVQYNSKNCRYGEVHLINKHDELASIDYSPDRAPNFSVVSPGTYYITYTRCGKSYVSLVPKFESPVQRLFLPKVTVDKDETVFFSVNMVEQKKDSWLSSTKVIVMPGKPIKYNDLHKAINPEISNNIEFRSLTREVNLLIPPKGSKNTELPNN